MIEGWRVEEHPRDDRAAWFALRQHDVTGSDAGALFGVHKYQTLRRMARQKAYGEDEVQTADMRRGKIMEPAVAEAIHLDCGWRPVRRETYLRARATDPLVRLGASLDYDLEVDAQALAEHPKTRATAEAYFAGHQVPWSREDGRLALAVECKSVDWDVFEREWASGPPDYTLVQGATQAMLAGADGALVACLLENRAKELYLYLVPRREDFELALIDKVREFWRAFEAGEEPPVIALDNDFMSDYYPRSDEGEVVNLAASDEAAEWRSLVEEREGLKTNIKQLQDRINLLEAKLKDRMRDAARAILPGWSITWKSNVHGTRSLNIKRAHTTGTSRKKR
mgnify:FL=1